MDLSVICFSGFCLWYRVLDIRIFAHGFYCRGKLFAWIFRYLGFISVVTIIFYLFGLWRIKTHSFVSTSHCQKINQPLLTTTAAAMDRFLNILAEPQPKPEENIDEEKLRHIASTTSIWDFYGIQQANYLAFSREEKMRMFKEYYNKSVSKFYGISKPTLFFLSEPFDNFLAVFDCLFSDIFLDDFLYSKWGRSNANWQWYFTSSEGRW